MMRDGLIRSASLTSPPNGLRTGTGTGKEHASDSGGNGSHGRARIRRQIDTCQCAVPVVGVCRVTWCPLDNWVSAKVSGASLATPIT
jgi:hypothetical protein